MIPFAYWRDGGCAPGKQTFVFTGSDQTFTVPAKCNFISIKAWGAGGAGSSIWTGGPGGYAAGRTSVTEGTQLRVVVGGQGVAGASTKAGGYGGGGQGFGGGGSGGGRSSLFSVDGSWGELVSGWAPNWASLIGYWKFNGTGSLTTGNSVFATVGTAATAANANGSGLAYTSSGQLGQAITFDGVDDSVVLGRVAALENVSAFTISTWLYPTAPSPWQTVFSKYGSSNHTIRIETGGFGDGGAGSRFALFFHVKNGLDAYGFTWEILQPNTWHHVVAVFNGAGAANADRAKIYLRSGAPASHRVRR